MIMAYTCIATQVLSILSFIFYPPSYHYQPIITQIIFYDGPEMPEGIYDDFLNIEPAFVDVGTKSLLDVIKLSPTNETADLG